MSQNVLVARRAGSRCLALCITFLVSLCSALAQTGGTGSVQGTVTDPTGAVVVGATVTGINEATGVRTVQPTTDTGLYVLSLLKPGLYTVTVTATGFQTLSQNHVIVDALATVPLNLKLSMGAATQVVTVESQPTMLNSDDVKLGSNIDNNVYDSLPLAMNQSARDPSAFAGLASGVDNYSTQAAGPSTGSFNGGQTYQNETYIEGLPLTSAGTESDTRNLAFGISVEAVEQFQVATSGSEAMYEGQGMSNYIVKSGTNKLHGGVYEYFRNTDFDAPGFFAARDANGNKLTPVEHQNEFGGSIGGAIIKNKLFFFGNYDGYRFDSAIPPSFQTIPTAAERTGDFSAFPIPIYNPNICLTTNGSGQCTSRQQFSYNGVLNVIPPAGSAGYNCNVPGNCLSKVAQSFESYLPGVSNTNLTNNYLATLPNLVNNDSTTDKVDWDISNKHRFYILFSRGKYANPIVGSLAPATSTTNSTLPVPYTDGRGVIEYATLWSAHETFTISPSLVNDFGYSVSRLFIPLTSDTASGNYPSKAGLTGLPPGIASTGFPDVTFSGNTDFPVSWDGTNSHAFNEAQTTYSLQDNILWTKGRHHFTFGFQWQALQDNENTPLTGTQAGFTFSSNETANFNSSGALINTTGLAYASYLLGAVDSSVVVQNSVAETGGRYKTYAPYIQDDIKVNSRLTVNVGLRWDLWSPFTEVQNHMAFFNPNGTNPLAGNILGALEFSGYGTDSCSCLTPVHMHYKNIGPRIGIAYRVGDKTVIRASYGIFYSHAGGVGGRNNGRQGLSQLGFNNSGSLSSTATGQPAYYWDGGYPGNPINPPFINASYGIGFICNAVSASANCSGPAPGIAAVGAGPSTAQTMVYGDPLVGGEAPMYQDWSLSVQHAFTPNMTLSVAYSASIGHHLAGAGVAGPLTDQIPVQYLPLGSLLTTTLTPASLASAEAIVAPLGAPIPWFSAGVPFPFFTGTIGQALRPYPQYSTISDAWTDMGNSAYNALQISFNRRFSRGLTFMANYTWSKELDDLAGVRYPGEDYLERAPGTIDHPTVATATFVYQLPFGKGHAWGGGNEIVSEIVGGWQISGIYTFADGAPLSIGGSCTGGGVVDAACYPSYAPGFTGLVWQNGTPGKGGLNVTTTHFLNSAAFMQPAPYTVGNVPRTAPYNLYAPPNQDIDLSVRREFDIYESLKFAIQVDAFNVDNEVHFSAPNTTLSSAAFGTFSATVNQPRKLQFSGRLTF